MKRQKSFAIKIPGRWEIKETEVTPEQAYRDRREFLKRMGIVTLGAAAWTAFPGLLGVAQALAQTADSSPPKKIIPQGQGVDKTPAADSVTPESLVSRYNNFYEFGVQKDSIWRLASAMETRDWTLSVDGLVDKPQVLDVEKLIRKMALEDRIYRLRCVETWSAIIPWRGFPFRDLIRLLSPKSSARYVKLKTFIDPNIAPGQKNRFWEPWPYTEGLTLEEAMHPLTFAVVGMYGHPLPPQNGAPIRLVIPWKYGFKSIKSIASIEFTEEQPEIFWQGVSPLEYDFWANVEPDKPYARWNQQFERLIGQEELVRTLPYNGYAKEVAGLYA